ncbi:MAG: bifunctional 4-hydroxy-3-methylbut-2-enyl diphosphate reductase/30S ribosomal protein S1, partial [Prolixibacteraceae bacterium]|nr:bifunctional 4-hydroxy-3-methylbut-2-enyl diphosphate reductase/30S ribosomal protein S1 [Prolixibacteraceae bacterium]
HNDAVIDYFAARGIKTIDSLEQLNEDNNGIIIRSHGISPDIIKQAEEKGIRIKDATCPLVSKVHKIVELLMQEEYEIYIFGDSQHPETLGILGWCNNNATVISNVEQAHNILSKGKIGLVSQTTKDEKMFLAVANALLPKATEIRVFNTICSATRNRIEQALEIGCQVDLMLVIGDKKSSNTTTLTKECLSTGVVTIQIERAEEIQPEWLQGVSNIGITAGASTPDWIIKEVLEKMTAYEEKDNQEQIQEVDNQDIQQNQEMENQDVLPNQETENQDVQNHEESFATMEAEMADIASPGKGDVIKGTVVQVKDDEVMVDVGGKSEGVIPLRELTFKDVSSAKEIIAVGDELEVLVLKWDEDGNILLSKKKVDAKREMDKLEISFNEGLTVTGKVTGSVKGGLLVDIGITSFLPASHIGDGFVKNLDDYIGREMEFKIIEFNRNKRRGSQVVVSRKELAGEERSKQREAFWSTIEPEQIRKGIVKRIIDYGAFLDLGGYEGLLHISELDYKRIPHPSDILTEGEEIDVFILGVDREKDRVSLSRKRLLKSPWEIVLDKYHEGDIIDGTVVRIAAFGAFVEIEPGVDGLVHISQLANYRVDKPESVVSVNQVVKVKILSIDSEQKRISLSIKEAQDDVDAQAVEEFLEKQEQSAGSEEQTEPDEPTEFNEMDDVTELTEQPEEIEEPVEPTEQNQPE